MTNDRDELAFFDLDIEAVNDRERTFRCRINFIHLRILKEAVLRDTRRLSRFGVSLRFAESDGCDGWKRTFDFRALFGDADIHQIGGDVATKRFERVIMVHFCAVTRTWQINFKGRSKSCVRARIERNDPVCKEDRFINIIRDQNNGLLVIRPDVRDLVLKVCTGECIQG